MLAKRGRQGCRYRYMEVNRFAMMPEPLTASFGGMATGAEKTLDIIRK